VEKAAIVNGTKLHLRSIRDLDRVTTASTLVLTPGITLRCCGLAAAILLRSLVSSWWG